MVPGAVSATIEDVLRLDAVADDLAAAMGALGGELVNGALETVEDMCLSCCNYLERQVVVVPANFALSHDALRITG
jgi:hypothetical protein